MESHLCYLTMQGVQVDNNKLARLAGESEVFWEIPWTGMSITILEIQVVLGEERVDIVGLVRGLNSVNEGQ